MAKLERHRKQKLDRPPTLSSWELVVALAVMAAAAIGTLMITGSTAAVTVVVGSLLLVLGASAARA